LIAMLARNPNTLMDANVALTRANLTVLREEDFLSPALRQGFRELSRAAMGQPLAPPSESEDDWLVMIADYDIVRRASDSVEAFNVTSMHVNETDMVWLREQVVRTALKLRERNLARDRTSIGLMIEEAKQADEVDVAARYNRELHQALSQLLRVQKALQLRSALNVT
jgi:hypothetical protein